MFGMRSKTFPEVDRKVKSDEGFAQIQQVLPTPQPPRWQRGLSTGLVIVGAITVVYAVVEFGRYAMRVVAAP